jgi:hypothetical protein
MKPLCITCEKESLEQGLFGQIFYHALQILPYLLRNGIYPQWELRSMHYGDPPEHITIPGALDLAYLAPSGPYRYISIYEIRRRHAHVLGNNWAEISRMWNSYFKVPPRIANKAQEIFPSGRVLGIHYRGTDKQTTNWDSNPISKQQYLTLIQDFLRHRSDFNSIFAATDEFSFVEKLRSTIDLPVVALGEVEFHLATQIAGTRAEKTDRALLDCMLLSRCACVIETSSALPSFAKVFNPSLEIYRTAASKLFGKLYTKMPYFPVAYIPVLPVRSLESIDILRETMKNDWTEAPETSKFKERFSARPRWTLNHSVYSFAEKLGVDSAFARFLSGHY